MDRITLKNVGKIYHDEHGRRRPVLENININIKDGEFFIIVGPSGSGKSTLLRIMSGLEKSFTGTMELAPGMSTFNTSFIFQSFALLPWLTVIDNVSLGLLARGVPHEEAHKKATMELQRLGLEKVATVHPHELSGGMKQRVGIARALATDPEVIFMDEPFSELDSFTAEHLRKEFLGIWQERKTTIVMVTHIVSEAIELADRIAVLSLRPGRIERIVTNELPRPRPQRSAPFFELEDALKMLIRP